MPITKSAKKALRQNEKRKVRNLRKKRNLKDLFKKINRQGSSDAKKLLPEYSKALDKAAKTGLIKKNTASRKKSRIMKMVNKKK